MNSKSPAPPLLRSRSCRATRRRSFLPALLAVTGLFASTAEVGAQVYKHTFGTTTITTHPYTVAPLTLDANLSGSSWSNSTNAWTSFAGSAGQAIALNNSGGTPSLTLTFSVASGYKLDVASMSFWRQRSASGAQNYSVTINGGAAVATGTVPTAGADTGALTVTGKTGLTGTVTMVMSLSGASGTGTFRLDDFTLNGTVSLVAATAPAAPTITTITPGDQQLSVAFTAGSDGGSAITNYKYSTDGGSTFTAVSPDSTTSPILITGLTNGTAYNVQIKAVNAIGDGTATASTSGTPRTVPAAPTITSITPGNELLSVAFTAGADGGSAITNYKYSTDNGATFIARSPSSTASPLVISGLTNATAYDVKLLAVNAAGDGAASTAVSGTPAAPVTPTITASGSLGALTTTYGTPSSNASFSVSGAALTADLVVTAPSGFAVSTSPSSGFASSINIPPSSGLVPITILYVRLGETTVVGSYSGNVGLASTGADPQSIATTSSSVTPASLTITGLSAAPKEYDGTTTASVTGTAAFNGLLNGDTFSPTGSVTWEFTTKTAGTAKPLTRTGDYATPSTNYTVTQPSLTADITTKTLTVADAVVTTRAYNAGTVAAITGATLSAPIGLDVVTLTNSTAGTFAQATVGTGINVTTTMGLTGADAANYTVTQPTLTGEITKADQTIIFAALPIKSVNDPAYSLTATASSGLAVSFSSPDTGVLTISGSSVTIVAIGTATITASQAGDSNYNAATSVDQSQVVSAVPVSWNFSSASLVAAAVPANATVSNFSRGNNNGTTTLLTITSPSSGYSGASGSENAGAAAKSTTLDTAVNGSAYFEFTVTPAAGFKGRINSLAFGSRSTTTGPRAYTLRSSADNYATDLVTGTFANNSNWALKSHSILTLDFGAQTTFRIYGYDQGGTPSAGTANWRVDDVKFGLVMEEKISTSVTTAPTAANITYGAALSTSLLSGGVGSVPGSFAFTTPASIPAAGTASQSVTFTPTDALNYKSVILNVDVTVVPASLPSLTFTDGVVTGSGGVASFSYGYVGRNGTTYSSATAPTAAGFYTVTATSTDPNYTGNANNDYFVTGPIAGNDNVTKPANNSATQYTVASLLANDTRIDGTGSVVSTGLSITAVTSGSGNTATLSGSDVLFTPSASSPETFTYTLSDGAKTTTATVTVTASIVQQDLSLKMTSIGTPVFAAGNTTVTHGFLGEPNQSCVIEYSTDLEAWTSAGTFNADGSGVISVEFTASGDQTTAWKKMFFRASSPPN